MEGFFRKDPLDFNFTERDLPGQAEGQAGDVTDIVVVEFVRGVRGPVQR